MRPWVLCVLAACSSERAQPGDRPPLAVGASGRSSIDVTVTGAPISIRGVEVAHRERGDLEVSYRAQAQRGAPRTALVPVRILCRVAGRNVVYPMTTQGMVPGPRLTSLFRPDPFSERPSACEIAFLYLPNEVALGEVAARACFVDGSLQDGPCPPEALPAPELPSAAAVVLERPLLELRNSSATVTGLFTKAQPLPDNRLFAARITCADTTGKVIGEAALTFVPLHAIPTGASMFGPITFALERTPSPAAQCTLEIVSRTIDDRPGGERVHAQYCLTTNTVQAGPC